MNVNPDETKSKVFSQENVAAPAADPEPNVEKTVKKRTWKKPKDKPKRPLSSYNIFFQHQRARIVEGETAIASPEDIVRSIEGILSKSREKRRHRKTHGRISFGDLARAIAEKWRSIDPKSKSIFDHYAEVDMLRYKREVKVWKEKKEMENEASAIAKHSSFINSMNSSFSSQDSASSLNFESLPPNKPAAIHDSFNSSFSSVDSRASDFSLEPEPIQTMIHRQQQILQQQLREVNPQFMGTSFNNQANQSPYGVPGSNALHASFGSLPVGNMSDFQRMQQHQNVPMGHSSFSDLQRRSGHSSFGDFQRRSGHSSFGDFQHRSGNPFGNTMQQMGHSSLNSLQFGDAILGPSNHVSDYSSSAPHVSSSHGSGFSGSYSGFASQNSALANSLSSGFNASDGLTPPSAFNAEGMQISDSNYGIQLQQQQQQQQQHGVTPTSGSNLENNLRNLDLERSNFQR